MLLCNEPISLIKVNKTLNNTKIYTHMRSQTNNILFKLSIKISNFCFNIYFNWMYDIYFRIYS